MNIIIFVAGIINIFVRNSFLLTAIVAAVALGLFIFQKVKHAANWVGWVGMIVAVGSAILRIVQLATLFVPVENSGFKINGSIIWIILGVLALIAGNIYLFFKGDMYSPSLDPDQYSSKRTGTKWVLDSLWYIYTCGIVLIYSAIHYTSFDSDCFSFFLYILHPDWETQITLFNIPAWPLTMKIILGITAVLFIVNLILVLKHKQVDHKFGAILEEFIATVDMLIIALILFWIFENILDGLDVLLWILLDMVLLLVPFAKLFPNLFSAYANATSAVAEAVFDSYDADLENKLDQEERILNAYFGDGIKTDEELGMEGKLSLEDRANRQMTRALRRHQRKQKKGN